MTTKDRLDELERQYREWCKLTLRVPDQIDSFTAWEDTMVSHSTARTMREVEKLGLRLFPEVDQ